MTILMKTNSLFANGGRSARHIRVFPLSISLRRPVSFVDRRPNTGLKLYNIAHLGRAVDSIQMPRVAGNQGY